MKRYANYTIILFTLLGVNVLSLAQPIKQVYEAREIVWLGIDFTKAKMVGDFGAEGQGKNLRDNLFSGLNDLIVTEKGKYTLNVFLNKDNVIYSIKNTSFYNSEIDPDSITLNSVSAKRILSLKVLKQITLKYTQEDKNDLGVLVVVEKFDKNELTAVIDLVFMERKTGKLLFAKRFYKRPSGGGLRNFWACTIFESLEETQKSWKSWMLE